jgi:ABC transporter with metal-binding/Fe-S-binding domain ATP-binding protein
MGNMRAAVLFSGGKDSTLAMVKATEEGIKVTCIVSIIPESEDSLMYHLPNISLTALQAEAMELPYIAQPSFKEDEDNLVCLNKALQRAKQEHGVKAVVAGAVASRYQHTRVQKVARMLGLKVISPLWMRNQEELLRAVLEHNIKAVIVGVAAHGLGKEWLGKELTEPTVEKLLELSKKYRFSPVGEGGELETFVIDAPPFHKCVKIEKAELRWDGVRGTYLIKSASLVPKQP